MQPTKLLDLIPTNHSHLFKVKLNLEHQRRYIGILDTSGEGKFLTDRREKHLYKKSNSLGLNETLLTSPDIDFKWIVIDYQGKKLITTRIFFVTHSKVFTFQGDEKQYFLPLCDFGFGRAKRFDNSISKQLGLLKEVNV